MIGMQDLRKYFYEDMSMRQSLSFVARGIVVASQPHLFCLLSGICDHHLRIPLLQNLSTLEVMLSSHTRYHPQKKQLVLLCYGLLHFKIIPIFTCSYDTSSFLPLDPSPLPSYFAIRLPWKYTWEHTRKPFTTPNHSICTGRMTTNNALCLKEMLQAWM